MRSAYNLPPEVIERDGWRYINTVTLRDKRGRISYWNTYEWEDVNG